MYFRFPLSLRNVEDLLHERGIDVSHETVRYRVSVRPDRPYDAVFHGSRSSTRLIFFVWNAGECIGQPCLRVDTVQFGRFR